jgi:hypothetical protein
MKTFDDQVMALPTDRANAARLSSAEDWRNKPTEAFKKFIRATPSRHGRGGLFQVVSAGARGEIQPFFRLYG